MSTNFEKAIKKASLELYKIRKEIGETSNEELNQFKQKIEKIEKQLLKETSIKFPDKVKDDFIELMQ